MGPGVDISITDKSYPVLDLAVFKDFRLTVAPSSIVALVGPSGVGKSTLLRMIAGIDNEYVGNITIAGQSAAQAAPAGFVFQDPRLLPWLTALENVTEMIPGITAEAARDMLGRVGLAGYEDAFPHELSGGMQRRVALARAATVNRDFWLFDEPFVSLDRPLIHELQAQILEMVAQHAPTLIFVTHVAEDAARLATRAVVLNGRPARIAADFELPKVPAERTPVEVVELAAMISSRSEGAPE